MINHRCDRIHWIEYRSIKMLTSGSSSFLVPLEKIDYNSKNSECMHCWKFLPSEQLSRFFFLQMCQLFRTDFVFKLIYVTSICNCKSQRNFSVNVTVTTTSISIAVKIWSKYKKTCFICFLIWKVEHNQLIAIAK